MTKFLNNDGADYPFLKLSILDLSKLKKFADGNFKFNENCRHAPPFCCRTGGGAGISSWLSGHWLKHMYKYFYCWADGWAGMSSWLNGHWLKHMYNHFTVELATELECRAGHGSSIFTVELVIELECRSGSTDIDWNICISIFTVELECRADWTYMDLLILLLSWPWVGMSSWLNRLWFWHVFFFCFWAGMSSWLNIPWFWHVYVFFCCWAGRWTEMSGWLNGHWFWHVYLFLLLSWPFSWNVKLDQQTLILTCICIFAVELAV